jgi:hypothetical protein
LWSSRQSMVKAGEGVWLASKACICLIHISDLSHRWTVCRFLVIVNGRWPMREWLLHG